MSSVNVIGLAVLGGLASAARLTKVGEVLVPNGPYDIQGLSGVCYDDRDGGTYYAVDDEKPYIYALRLDFFGGGGLDDDTAASYEVLRRSHVDEDGIKFEDCAVQRWSASEDAMMRLWTVSEINDMRRDGSRRVASTFLGVMMEESGEADQSNLDRDGVTQDRFLTFDDVASSSVVPRSRPLDPAATFHYAKDEYDWDWRQCHGSRPFRGVQGSSFSPSGRRLVVAEQYALYQDGPQPTYYDGSATRILLYDVVEPTRGVDSLRLFKTLRYDVEPLHRKPPHPWSFKWSAVVGVAALEDDRLLVLEVSFVSEKRTKARVFELAAEAVRAAPDVTACAKLDDQACGAHPVAKRLVLDLDDVDFRHVKSSETLEWDGMTLGPEIVMNDGARYASVVIVNDIDGAVKRRRGGGTRPIDANGEETDGSVFAMFALDADADSGSDAADFEVDRTAPTSKALVTAAIGALALVVFFSATWALGLKSLRRRGFRCPRSLDDLEPRVVKLVFGLARSFLFGGVAFGWPAMQLIARQQGVYGRLCACGFQCSNMRGSFALVNTLGFALTIGSRLLWGYHLDRLGPKLTSTAGLGVVAAGFFVLAAVGAAQTSTPRRADALFVVGWCLLAAGGGAVHIANFHVQNLFPQTRNAASASFSMVLTGSSLIFPILQLALQGADGAHRAFEIAMHLFGALALLFAAHAALSQPWRPYPKPPKAPAPAPPTERKAAAPRIPIGGSSSSEEEARGSAKTMSEDATAAAEDDTGPSSTTRAPPRWRRAVSSCCAPARTVVRAVRAYEPSERLHGLPLRQQLRTFEFVGETAYFALALLLVQLYLATIANQLFFKGDQAFSALPNQRTDSLYTKMAGFVNGLGGLWFPANAYLLEDAGYPSAVLAQCALAAIFHVVLLASDQLAVTVLAMLAHAGARNLLFSFHFAYLARVFGMRTFGTLNGITSLVAAVVGVASYPIQLWVVFDLDGDYTIQNAAGAILSVALATFPVVLALKSRTQQHHDAADASSDVVVVVVDADSPKEELKQEEATSDGAACGGPPGESPAGDGVMKSDGPVVVLAEEGTGSEAKV